MLLDDLESAKLPSKRGEITGWSQKSRARMTLRLATIDYTPLFIDGLMPAMVTLTLPGDWERVAPTPDAYRVLVNKFRKRFWNSWGREMPGVWKLEFQHRGAPHLHILTTPPAGRASAPRGRRDLEHLRSCSSCDSVAHDRSFEFSEWLSRTWASVVNHPSEADRYKHEGAGTNVSYQDVENYGDPKRIGVYFSKHGSFADKEYQNVMPELWKGAEGGGIRFWGYWVVRPLIVSQETHEALIMCIMSSPSLSGGHPRLGRMTIRTFYDRWPQYNQRLTEVVAAMTDEQLAIRPSPEGLPIWATVGHTAAARAYWLCGVLKEPGAEATPWPDALTWDGWEDHLDHPRTATELVWALDSTWAVVDRVVDSWEPSMLPEEVERWHGDNRQLHSRASILQRLLTHDAYHCGELSQTLGIAGLPQIDLWRPIA